MDDTLDKTSLATISLLEARLLRVENIIYGLSDAPAQPSNESVSTSLADLERRFAALIRRTRIYAEILKICMSLIACQLRQIAGLILI